MASNAKTPASREGERLIPVSLSQNSYELMLGIREFTTLANLDPNR
jgi:hypothetical protein